VIDRTKTLNMYRKRRRKMKKAFLATTTAVVVLLLAVCTGYAQPMGRGMMGPGYGYGASPEEGWNYCPYCGSYTGPGYGMMGPGMMGRGYGGYGMGPGMMGRGYGGHGMMGPGMMGRGYGGYGMMGPGMMGPGFGYGPRYGYGPQSQEPPKPLDKEQAKQEVQNYLKSIRNPNLKIGKIEDKGNDYEVGIETKEGSLVDKILVRKDTGWMRSAY
jgi:hypothetical protein